MASILSSSSSFILASPNSNSQFRNRAMKIRQRRVPAPAMAASSSSSSPSSSNKDGGSSSSTKLVTFLGKGGSGKTTSAVFAAQHYAMAGLDTCLVIQSQDPTAEFLLNCKIGTSPVMCCDNLSAVRLETTKIILEPLNLLKQADARLNMTQGVLEGVVGEELGVLPGMDSIFSGFALERFLGYLRNVAQKSSKRKEFDVVIYDGISTEETLRLIGAASKARLYLKYLRSLAEKTDLGRLAGPSILRLVDEAMGISSSSRVNGKLSAEIWETLDHMLERGSSAFLDPSLFCCFLMMDPSSIMSVNSALRYWGCTIQSDAHISGAIAFTSQHMNVESVEELKKKFSPLPLAFIPSLSMNSPLNWKEIILDSFHKDARDLFSLQARHGSTLTSPVKFDAAKKSVTLFMPGFDKSEIKLYQRRV
ncbi:uncharacterized protein At1g26090, chloroplastic isoform X2 [Tripterygium wilfordii]|uniref:uncharacterized protein At1g26090, chloroplastic isoform X2 n=1 Tax=Tripterygium wilfordii TaxID=458696 RepID=UPI0018F855ED|nr:uncharacterized protein At1g26090, chloroplastic isoform X2 [Tripterygium wilfordii]